MGYVYVLIAVFAGVAKGFLGKKLSADTSSFQRASLYNLLRMAACMGIGLLLCTVQSGIGSLAVAPETLAASVLYGVSTAAMVVSWLLAVQYSAYVMLEVFLVLGTVVPIFGSAILFGEIPALHQVLGVLIICAAVYLMCGYSASLKGKMTARGAAILIVCGVANGVGSLAQKIFSRTASGDSNAAFNFYGYVFAFLALLAVFLTLKTATKEKKEAKPTVTLKICLVIFFLSVFLFVNSFFQTAAAAELAASVLFPMTQGLSLVLSTVMSVVAFNEKASKKSIFGTMMAFVGMVILNL